MTWDLLESPAADAATNMAVDDVLLRTAPQRGRPLLRVYSWLKPAVSIGYFQKFPENLAGNYEIVRRPTGGGLVYHGKDSTFTVVVPAGHFLHKATTAEAYRRIHETLAAVVGASLQSFGGSPRGQYECFQQPVAGDVIADGQKLAGGAQRRNRDGMLHQGSIAVMVNVAQLADGFRQNMNAHFQPYQLTAEEQIMVKWLADDKYATNAWNHRC